MHERGTLPPTLATRYRPPAYSPILYSIHRLGKRLARRSFTRRVVVKAFQVVNQHAQLPSALELHPHPAFPELDGDRYVADDAYRSPGNEILPTVLLDRRTGRRYIFKGPEATLASLPAIGIDKETQPQRAYAAFLAAEALGVAVPPVRLVTYRGARGSLQELITESVNLAELHAINPRLFARVTQSRKFEAARSDIWILDRFIGAVDRNIKNILVRGIDFQSQDFDEEKLEVYAADFDMSFPPTPDVKPLLGLPLSTPRAVCPEVYRRLRGIVAGRSGLPGRLAALLTTAEIDAAMVRGRRLCAMVEATQRQRGAGRTFFGA